CVGPGGAKPLPHSGSPNIGDSISRTRIFPVLGPRAGPHAKDAESAQPWRPLRRLREATAAFFRATQWRTSCSAVRARHLARMSSLPSLAEIEAVGAQVDRVVPPTPQFSWPLLNTRAGCELWVKHDN